jgi:hypothetical protein
MTCCWPAVWTFLAIAVPFTGLWWGWAWWWKTHWSRVPPDRGDRRLFRILLGWVIVILAELAVFVCVGAR